MSRKGKTGSRGTPKKSPRAAQLSLREEKDFDEGDLLANLKDGDDDIDMLLENQIVPVEFVQEEGKDEVVLSDKIEEEIEELVATTFDEVKSNQSLSEMFRKELENYLGDMEAKVSSDGEKLIKVPENFETIVNAMTREDLFDDENEESTSGKGGGDIASSSQKMEKGSRKGAPPLPPGQANLSQKFQDYQKMKKENKKSWYRYLMQDYISQDMNKEFEGRYDSLLAPADGRDEKVRKGLAEIFLLDRELFNLTKKAGALTDQTPRPLGTPLSTGRSGADTPGSRQFDRTFLTKHKAGSAASTPRSQLGQVSPEGKKGRAAGQGKGLEGFDEEDDGGDEDGEGSAGAFVYRPYRQLSADQLRRIDELLAAEDDAAADPALSFYSPDDLAAQEQLDQQLAEFGRMDRLADGQGQLGKGFSKNDGNDYLRQQRRERKEKEQAKKIDEMLAGLSGFKEVDYSHFFSASAAEQSAASRSQLGRPLHEVPALEEVKLEVPITREDIACLVDGLRREVFLPQKSLGSASAASSSSLSPRPFSADPSTLSGDAAELVPAELLASDEQIRGLLASLHTEAQRLQLYRDKAELSPAPARHQQQQRPREESPEAERLAEAAQEREQRPFSPSDLAMLPDFLLAAPAEAASRPQEAQRPAIRFDPTRLGREEAEPVFSLPPIHQQRPRKPRSAPDGAAAERRVAAADWEEEADQAEEERVGSASSNPFAIHRRVRPKQSKASAVTESPRRSLHARAPAPAQQTVAVGRPVRPQPSSRREERSPDFEIEGDEEEEEEERGGEDDDEEVREEEEEDRGWLSRRSVKQMLVDKVRQFVEC